MGRGPNVGQNDQEEAYPLSQCMSCGCCLEACPQFTKIELRRRGNESSEEFAARKSDAFDHGFIGPHAIGQAVLFNSHPTGKLQAADRLEALTEPGGIQICGNAQNCVAVCPKEIPLTTSIAKAGRATTVYKLKKWFDK
jgi:succinate dehydrogenase / fumarate reductase iron-sulfur subunit